MSFYTDEELPTLGLKSYGKDVKISRYARFYNPQFIEIGNNVRIDDFCIFSASVNGFIIRNYVHISAGVYIYGSSGIVIDSYSNISGGVKIYTSNDDYSGKSLVGPTVPFKYRNVDNRMVIINQHCVIGCNSVILPGVTINEGVAVGSNSLVKQTLDSWSIYAGNPVRLIKQRSKTLLEYIHLINTNDI